MPELDAAHWPVNTLADWLDEFVAELLAATLAESSLLPASVNAELSSDVLFAVAEDELSWEPVTSDVFDASEEPDVTLALAVRSASHCMLPPDVRRRQMARTLVDPNDVVEFSVGPHAARANV